MSMSAETWLSHNSRLPTSDAARRISESARDGSKLALLLLSHNNAQTIGRHLLLLQHGWPGGHAPWHEIMVADLGSSDATVEIARAHGAKILENPQHAIRTGMGAHGDGLGRALEVSDSDILAVAPASLVRVELDALASLLAVLLDQPSCRIALGAESAEGSVLSRYSLRPLLAALCQPLSLISDPASPLLALRTQEIKALPLARSNGYEAALVIDCWNHYGLESIVQVLTGPLHWSGPDPRADSTHAFHSQLAALEALHRAGRLQIPGQFGHILPTPETWDENGPRVVSRLEIFPWRIPEEPSPFSK